MVSINQKKLNLSLKINTRVLLAYFCFLGLNIIYYWYFTRNWECYASNPKCGEVFYHVLIGDAMKAYIRQLAVMFNEGWIALNPGHTISYIYYFLAQIFRFKIENIFFVAFLVNNISVVISYVFFVRIGREIIGLNMRYRWLYFLNPMLIFSSQMISKEFLLYALTVMIAYYSLVSHNRIYRQPIVFLFTLLITALVRFPILALMSTRFFIKENQVRIKRLIFVCLALLIYNGFRLSTTNFEDDFLLNRSPGLAMNALIYNQYYLGSLIMAPAKIFANFYDLILSLFTPLENGRFNLYTISTIPLVIVFLAQYRSIFYILRHPVLSLKGPLGPLLAFVIVFLIIVSGNIYIHSRYLWPIMPLLILVLIGIRVKILDIRVSKLTKNIVKNQ